MNNSSPTKTRPIDADFPVPGVAIYLGDCVETMEQLEPESVDALVSDPPYGIGFMGKEFDKLGKGSEQMEFHRRWAAAAFRILKPGAYLIAMGSPRTYHHLATGIEAAGFEIRDSIHWIYGSGFPKSLDPSKAIDRKKHNKKEIKRVTAWIAGARDAAEITNAEIDAAFGFNGMAGHWTSQGSQPSVPTLDQVPVLLSVLKDPPIPPEIEHLIITINKKKGQPAENWTKREAIGVHSGPGWRPPGESAQGAGQITAPYTDQAKKAQGLGTALKPAHEPAVLARKPPIGTIVDNLAEHGTGCLNIDASRVGSDAVTINRFDDGARPWGDASGEPYTSHESIGRWPPNIALSHGDGCGVRCVDGCPVAEMDRQSGASRYFPIFQYCAKPSTAEREAGCWDLTGEAWTDGRTKQIDNPRLRGARPRGNSHPTVKPIELMRWLIRLVTPPGGVVIDPFMGSGSTMCAAALEQITAIGCEMNPDYMEIARRRVLHWANTDDARQIALDL